MFANQPKMFLSSLNDYIKLTLLFFFVLILYVLKGFFMFANQPKMFLSSLNDYIKLTLLFF